MSWKRLVSLWILAVLLVPATIGSCEGGDGSSGARNRGQCSDAQLPNADAESLHHSLYRSHANWTRYHSYDMNNSMVKELFNISTNYSSLTKLVTIGKTWQGRDIYAMKISDNPDVEENEPEVLFDACTHSREWMTTEVAMYIIHTLVENYTKNATITDMVNSRQIWVIPIVNPDGRVYDGYNDGIDPTQNHMWRKNLRDNNNDGLFEENEDGVDLNRNYDFKWANGGSSDYPGSETYMGPYGGSEPETRAFQDFTAQHRFSTHITYHSYSQLILYPWGYTNQLTPDDALFQTLAQNLSSLITNKAGSVNPGYQPMNDYQFYQTSGTTLDYMYGARGAISFTIEVFPTDSDYPNDYSTLFHPPQDKILPVCQDNIEAALFMAKIAEDPYQFLPYHMSLSANSTQLTMKPSETRTLNVSVLNDGYQVDSYALENSTIPGWSIGVPPPKLQLVSRENKTAKLTITVPPNAMGGNYALCLNCSSLNDSSLTKSVAFSIFVPYGNDTGALSINNLVNMAEYIEGNLTINATVRNFGWKSQNPFDSACEIAKLGANTQVTVFSDDFDGQDKGWTLQQNSADDWQKGSPNYPSGPQSAYSLPNCWGTNLLGVYPNDANDWLISPEVSLPYPASNISLKFRQWFKTEAYGQYLADMGYVRVSPDSGKSWDLLAVYGGTSSGWVPAAINLTKYSGKSIMFAFQFLSDTNTQEAGWYIDDVSVEAEVPSEALVYRGLNSTAGVMAEGQTEFLDWTYEFSPGEYRVSVYTQLPGDEFQGNNCTFVIIVILSSQLGLKVDVTANPSIIYSNGTSKLKVHVTNDTLAMQDANISLVLASGSCSPSSGKTNASGDFETTFFAPTVYSETIVTIIANASKPGFLNGSDTTDVYVEPRTMSMTISSPATMESGTVAEISAVVKFQSSPLKDADVNFSADKGSCSPPLGKTNNSGGIATQFTAPIVTTATIVIVYANASKQGYLDASASATVCVTPAPPTPTLSVFITADSSALLSEETTMVHVKVLNGSQPVANADVDMHVAAVNGSFAPFIGKTDGTGFFNTTYYAPKVDVQKFAAISANASKSGFYDGGDDMLITVNPKPKPNALNVSISSNMNSVNVGGLAVLTVTVTSGGVAVESANIRFEVTSGTMNMTSNRTNTYGELTAQWTAPDVKGNTFILIIVNASKVGFNPASGSIRIEVRAPQQPQEQPMNDLLMGIATVVIVVFLIVLVIILYLRRQSMKRESEERKGRRAKEEDEEKGKKGGEAEERASAGKEKGAKSAKNVKDNEDKGEAGVARVKEKKPEDRTKKEMTEEMKTVQKD